MVVLEQLHDAIARVCPIDGIADLGDGNYRIDFKPEATDQQQQAAWQALATYEPSEQPNWEQFRSQTLINGAYLEIVTFSPITQTLNTALVALLWRLGESPQLMMDVANTWGAIVMIAKPSTDKIEKLNGIAIACRMPFRLNEQGFMIADQ